jgi:hypothetical protein
MTAPVGAVFFFDYKYGSTKGSTTAGAIFPRDFDRDYSSEFVRDEALSTGDGTNFGGAGAAMTAVLAWTPVRPLNAALGFSVQLLDVDATGTVIQTATDDASGGFTGDASAGAINYGSGAVTAFKFTAAPATGNSIVARYFYDGELNTKIPQVNLDITKQPIEAIPRRLKALCPHPACWYQRDRPSAVDDHDHQQDLQLHPQGHPACSGELPRDFA